METVYIFVSYICKRRVDVSIKMPTLTKVLNKVKEFNWDN